jgi:excisionase family DNA binding protein
MLSVVTAPAAISDPMGETLRSLTEQTPPDHIPAVLGALEAASATLWARLHASQPAASEPRRLRLLTPQEAAARLTVSVRWIYRHADQLGAVRHSRRQLRFPEHRLERWIAARS